MKRWWLEALDTADTFIRSRPGKETGCLYYATNEERFVAPTIEQPVGPEHAIVAHYGQPGAVLPRLVD